MEPNITVKKPTYPWAYANSIGERLKAALEPFCKQIMIVGSLRRECPEVHDIDIVYWPMGNEPFLQIGLNSVLGDPWQWLKGKNKIIRGEYCGIPVDLYFATADTWWTIVLIRTGSAGHNIRMCWRAKCLGLKLHADGSGLEDLDLGSRRFLLSEREIFEALQLDYLEARDRR